MLEIQIWQGFLAYLAGFFVYLSSMPKGHTSVMLILIIVLAIA